jgi:type IV secretory pathway VirB10-like protein
VLDQNDIAAESRTVPQTSAASVRDHRPKPRGVLPRHVQMWLMVGISVAILSIIFFTGRPEATPQTVTPGQMSLSPAAPIQPERVRSYQERLAEQEARLRRELAEQPPSSLPPPPSAQEAYRSQGAATADPVVAERRRREYDSLFADNIALSRRPSDRQPYGEDVLGGRGVPAGGRSTVSTELAPPTPQELAAFQQFLGQLPTPAQAAVTGPSAPRPAGTDEGADGTADRAANRSSSNPSAPRETAPITAQGPLHRLLEGTVIETVLTNRLDGAFSGPVNCLVTTPVYSHSRQHVVIPAGARVLGTASAVQGWGESRLAVSFHRLLMPDGRTFSLEQFKGVNQIGETGLKDQVNRHYMQVFGASLAIGALSGLAQYGTGGGFDAYTFGDAYRQSAGASLAASTGRVLDRYLNVLPTVTIREGHRIKIYLTNDLELPAYSEPLPASALRQGHAIADEVATSPGGIR